MNVLYVWDSKHSDYIEEIRALKSTVCASCNTDISNLFRYPLDI